MRPPSGASQPDVVGGTGTGDRGRGAARPASATPAKTVDAGGGDHDSVRRRTTTTQNASAAPTAGRRDSAPSRFPRPTSAPAAAAPAAVPARPRW